MIILGGCVYKQDIHQGNVLEAAQIEQLEIGMSKTEVIALLGSPQLTDPFHTHRWDYYSSSKTNNQREKTKSVVTLLFEQDSLAEILN
jgi:outer membrane protein assembly factor BamE